MPRKPKGGFCPTFLHVHVRAHSSNEIVRSVRVRRAASAKAHQKVVVELYRRLDTDTYYVDDGELRAYGKLAE